MSLYPFTPNASPSANGMLTQMANARAFHTHTLSHIVVMTIAPRVAAIAPELIRFPSLNPDILRSRAENFIDRFEGKSEVGQP